MAKKTNSRTHRPPAAGNKTNPLATRHSGKQISNQTIRVPEGYENAGQPVNVARVSVISDEIKTTVGLRGDQIQTGVQNELIDLGMTTPVDMGDRVIDMSLSEYMRSREIEFTGKAFMPNAKLYPFFDGVNVSQYCKPKLTNGSYGNYGDELICDNKGEVKGIFKIPNDVQNNIRFKTGTKAFRLTTSSSNQTNPPPASFAETKYHATGWVTTKQKTTYSTRASTYNITSISKNLGSVNSEGSMLEWGSPCPRDPISESFFVYDDGGCFITAIDLFFYKKPSDPNKPQSPIILQLRDLSEGGNPSTTILPMGEIVKNADEIVINHFDGQKLTVTGNSGGVEGVTKGPWTSTSTIKADSGNTINDGESFISSNPALDMIPTRFTFSSPIYLAQNTSYCFVLLSDSNEYNVWVAQSGPDVTGRDGVDAFRNIGEVNTEIGTSNPIQKDPYIQGVYFKSQNGISWTPDQTIDIKFKIWKAKFKTERTGEVDFANGDLPLDKLTTDPLLLAKDSSKIRVIHPFHGHTVGSKVVFSGVSGGLCGLETTDSRYSSGASGLNLLNRTSGHWITKVELDSYLIDISLDPDQPYTSGVLIPIEKLTLPTTSGKVGGTNVYSTTNVKCDEIHFLTTPLELPGTSIKWNIQTTASQSVNEDSSTPYEIMPRMNISPNTVKVFDRPMQVNSYINERTPLDNPPGPSQANDGLGEHKSIQIRALLSSTNPNISPVLDESRLSVVCTANRINNPAGYIPVGSSINENCVINDVYDTFQCLPPIDPPLISGGLSGKLYFSSSTGVLTGTLSGSGTVITGTGTKFLTELSTGDVIKESTTGEERFVVSIANNTSMTINSPFGEALSSSTVYAEPPPLRIKTSDDDVAKHLSKLDIGKLVTISDATGDRNVDDVYVLEVNYTPDNTIDDDELGAGNPCLCEIVLDYRPKQASGFETSSSIKIVQKDRYVDEIAPNSGSCAAKYLSKVLTLANPANTLKIMFDAYRHQSNTIDLYYRVKEINDATAINNTNWTLAEFNLDKGGELVTTVPASNDNVGEFSAYESNIQNLPSFSAVQIKIVMRGGNTARIPKIKKLVVIALEE